MNSNSLAKPIVQKLLKFLINSPLHFVIIGGFAAVLHGSNHTTRDLDICILFSKEEWDNLKEVLKPIHPKIRSSQEKISLFESDLDYSKIESLHLETDLGLLDLVSKVPGIGNYFDVVKNADEIEIYKKPCFVISINDLIKSKKILGRHRDLVVVEELEAILKEKM